jgi:hypothetical protein
MRPDKIACEVGWSLCPNCPAEVRIDRLHCASCGTRMNTAGVRLFIKPKEKK